MEGSPKMRKLIAFFFMTAIVLFGWPDDRAAAAEDLQALIDSAEEGAVLQLENKTYQGNITISKALTLIGSTRTSIKGDGTGNVVSIHASGVELHDLTVSGSSMNRNSAEEYAAVKIYSDHNVLDNLTVKNSYHGVYLSKADHNTIKNSVISGSGNGEIAGQGNGLHVYYSNNNIFENNRISGSRDGMFFDYANNNRTINNHISETRYGLHYMYSDDNIFKGNIFTLNSGGAAVMNSNRLTLTNNEFIFNYGHRSFGLLILSANDNEIENNTFYLNQRGLYIDQSSRNMITNNRIIQNQIGIELWASSSEQVFSKNQIHGNSIPALTLGGSADNSWNADGTGNDWGSQFPLADLDQNGIGDQPVSYYSSLYEQIEDQELTYLFLKSPAIKLFDRINGLLQKNDKMFEDHYPLVQTTNKEFQKGWLIFAAVIALLILIRGRNRLCITFGRNGRKA
ncbi:nitrous oxide reductase family maturation protein NosD [Bacillus canaveralius]|uniref:Nitrous oxide reductase family maturation protein NosD n=2 Tax=Bacillus canaveralius TaxID=1403243 RepID=A0A2N5GJW7_9BACI|nr:nitrous oxide reductase family maturation protein NosD [Bacillus canaveralius]PLR90860.1 nitrous oxide reductase family maturation protein NosD [Bacillus canaveralius]